MTKSTMVYVDDDEVLLSILEDELLNYYQVTTFSDPEKALEYIQQHKEQIQILVSDWNMPRLNGLQLIDKVATLNHRIKRILLTGYVGMVADQQQSNCHLILEKGILKKMEDFVSQIDKV